MSPFESVASPPQRIPQDHSAEWLGPPELREAQLFTGEAVEIKAARDLMRGFNPQMAEQMFSPKVETTEPLSLLDEIERLGVARNITNLYNKVSERCFGRACTELDPGALMKFASFLAAQTETHILGKFNDAADTDEIHFPQYIANFLILSGLLEPATPAEKQERISLALSSPGLDEATRDTLPIPFEGFDDWEMQEISLAKTTVAGWNPQAGQQEFFPREDATDEEKTAILKKAKEINYFLTWTTDDLVKRVFVMLPFDQAIQFVIRANKGDHLSSDDQILLEKTPHFVDMVVQYLRGLPVAAYDMEGRIVKHGLAEREPQFFESASDYDESDFLIMAWAEPLHLSQEVTPETLYLFCEAFHRDDRDACKAAVESARGRKLSEDEGKRLQNILDKLLAWKQKIADPFDTELSHIRSLLPMSARNINVWHAGFQKSRVIAPFEKILQKKMGGTLLVMVMDAVERLDSRAITDVARHANMLYTIALKSYMDVHKNGTPTLRSFAEYLAKHALSGEFHVGRDTRTTTWIASNAFRWGKMTAQDRLHAIRHIDISRTLLARTDKMILKQFLEQEGINEVMMGIDGGYHGSGQEQVMLTLNPDLSEEQLDAQIKLIATASTVTDTRRFDPDTSFLEVVEWMEGLPKFTERAQMVKKIERDGFAKYFVATSKRSEPERLLAWVVQHAVWREMIPKSIQKEKAGRKE